MGMQGIVCYALAWAWQGAAQGQGNAGMLNAENRLYPAPKVAPSPAQVREALAVRFEWFLLLVRYASYSMLLAAYAVGGISEYTPDLFLVTLGALGHNVFVHFVLFTRRHSLFLSPLNLFLHLLKISLLTGITGGADSPFALLFLLPIVGYALYSTSCRQVWTVVLATSFMFAGTLLVEWSINGIDMTYPVMMYFISFGVLGHMVDRIGEVVNAAEEHAQERAQSLVTSEATLRAILDSTPLPILVCEDSEMVVDANERACGFLNIDRDHLLGRRLRAFLFDDGTLPQKLAALRAKGAYRGEFLVLKSSGEERDVDLVIRSFMREGRRFHVAMLIDITEQKNFQEASRVATLRLERLNNELREVNDLRLAFYTTVAQRIRSPLTAIAGYADLLLEEALGPLNADQRGAVKNTRECSRRVFDQLDSAFENERARSDGARQLDGESWPELPKIEKAEEAQSTE
jgi:PAS domain S-box-containing protein